MGLFLLKYPRRCCFVVVTGFSGSGKTTVAHLLARQLGSPFHPISLDDFFDAARCEALETFDDFRTINFASFARAMRELKSILNGAMSPHGGFPRPSSPGPMSSWREEVKIRLPWIEKYLVDGREGAPTANEEEVREDGNGGSTAKGEEGEGEADEDGLVSEDSSLLAQEEEGRRWCRETAAAVAKRTPNLAGTEIAKEEEEPVLYVVCEGISIFCEKAVLGLHEDAGGEGALFDLCVPVVGGFEAACLRRFLRTPRRHWGSRSYEKRIQKMWSTRSETRRGELLEVLTEAFDSTRHLLYVLPPDRAASVRALREKAEAACQALLRAGGPFFPPVPAFLQVGSLVEEGGAAFPWMAFDDFWRSEYQPCREFARAAPTVMDWAVFSPDNAAFVEAALRAAPNDNGQAVNAASLSPKGRLGMYLVFRYWFFFEVLYYHHLFEPLQTFFLSLHTALAGVGGAAGMEMLRIDNSRSSGLEQVENQVRVVAKQIRLHFSSIR